MVTQFSCSSSPTFIVTKDLAPNKWPHALDLLGIDHSDRRQWTKERPEPDDVDDPPVTNYGDYQGELQGAWAACAIIDDICDQMDEANNNDESIVNKEEHKEIVENLKRSCASFVAATPKPKEKAKKPRRNGRLPGWGTLIEICTDENSNMGKVAQ